MRESRQASAGSIESNPEPRIRPENFLSMASRKIVVRNVIWNWLGMAVTMIAGFITAPFLVRRLGDSTYGLWILIASFTSYFGMLDLGVRGAVGRQIAFRHAQGNRRGVDSILSTSLAILAACGLLSLLITVGVSFAFTRVFDVPPESQVAARIALILIGVNLALWLPLNVFDGTLWAAQRFDVLNAIDVVSILLRTGLTFALIANGGGLVTLAWLNLLSLAGSQAAKAVATFLLDPDLRISPELVSRETARELFGYGSWNFLINAAKTLTTQASPMVVGLRLGIAFVTPFSITTRLIGYAGALIVAGTGVLTPIATKFHADGSADRQRQLFSEGGKYCLCLSLYFVTFYLLLGRGLIVLWMGPAFGAYAILLAILSLGEALPMSQWITHGLILGMSRHRPLALANITECAIAILLALVLAGPFGLVGVCIAFAIPALLCRGIFQVIYGCRLLGISPGRHMIEVILPGIGLASAVGAAMVPIVVWYPPRSNAILIVYAIIYTLVYCTGTGVFLVGPQRLRAIGQQLAGKLKGTSVRDEASSHNFPPASLGSSANSERQPSSN